MAQLVPPESFHCDVRDGSAGVVALAPVGELDDATVREFGRLLREIKMRRLNVLIFDLRGLTFIDAVGVHLIFDAHSWARRAGVELVVIQGPRAVRRVFELTRVDHELLLIDADPAPAR